MFWGYSHNILICQVSSAKEKEIGPANLLIFLSLLGS